MNEIEITIEFRMKLTRKEVNVGQKGFRISLSFRFINYILEVNIEGVLDFMPT